MAEPRDNYKVDETEVELEPTSHRNEQLPQDTIFHLRNEEISEFPPSNHGNHGVPDNSEFHRYHQDLIELLSENRKGGWCERIKRNVSWMNVALLCLLIGTLILFYVQVGRRDSDPDDSITKTTVNGQALVGEALSSNGKAFIRVGMRNDYLLQACGESDMKQSFPDVDYAMFGYDILKGFPLAVGHDPGFTLPIFRADYSLGGQSADCRYSVPKGVTIVPDVSCVTSFSSEIIKTEEAYSSSLSVSVGVQGSGWGASFSLSAGYNKAKSELENREKVYVLSSASCKYYFSKLVQSYPPDFDWNFLQWVRRLESSDDEDTYLQFFNTFGTHFPVETTFGARFTYEHSMSTEEFQSKESQQINVAMAASYSGLFSVGGSFSLNSEQEKQASSFSQNIETKTVTVGAAPPSNGDAMTWASTVQLNPVPVNYKLSSIENLFTAEYMKRYNIDYAPIYRNIVEYKNKYPLLLTKKALAESCKSREERYVLLNDETISDPSPIYTGYGELSDCLDDCFEDEDCTALSYKAGEQKCLFFSSRGKLFATERGTNTYELRRDNFATLTWRNTEIKLSPYREQADITIEKCEEICKEHALCYALTYSTTCRLYKRDDSNLVIVYLKDAITKFVSKCDQVDAN